MLKNLCSRLLGGVFAFAISFSGVMCIATAFRFEVQNVLLLAVFCAAFALCSALLQGKWLWWIPAVALGILVVIFRQSLWQSLQSLLYQISLFYSRAYNWPVFSIDISADAPLAAIDLALAAMAAPVQLLVLWSVCHSFSSIPALVGGFALLAPCLVVTDTMPGVMWVMLMLLCLLVVLLSAQARSKALWQGTKLSALLLLPVAAMLCLLLQAFPQEQYSFQKDLQSIAHFLEELFPLSVEPSLEKQELTGLRTLSDIEKDVMDVRTSVTGSLYLRGAALDTYTGTSWEASGERDGLYWPNPSIMKENARSVYIVTDEVLPVKYTSYYCEELLHGAGNRLLNDLEATRYGYMCSVVRDLHKYSGRTVNTNYAIGALPTTQLPEETAQWAVPLAQMLTDKQIGPLTQVEAITAFVRSCGSYSRTTQAMPWGEKDLAQWFIESGADGFCVHYATAATVLLRAAGFPARYVSGYMLQMEANRRTTVTSQDAHAWVEVFIEGLGWIAVDPTPYTGIFDLPEETTQDTTLPPMPTDPTEPSGSEPTQETTLPGPTEQTRPQQTQPETTETVPGQDLSDSDQPVRRDSLWQVIQWVFAGLAVIGCIWGQWRLRLWWLQYRLRKAAPNQRAVLLYRRLLAVCRQLKKKPAPELSQLVQKARFSQHTLTPAELREFSMQLRSAQQALTRKPFYLRLYYRLVLALY